MNMHTISLLAQIAQTSTPPVQWRILRFADNSYTLEFSYDRNKNLNFDTIKTRRGDLKFYKTLTSVFSDIEKVTTTTTALIHYELKINR